MNGTSGQAERKLRDYPISLRQSARAVFGSDYDSAEKRAHAVLVEKRELTKS